MTRVLVLAWVVAVLLALCQHVLEGRAAASPVGQGGTAPMLRAACAPSRACGPGDVLEAIAHAAPIHGVSASLMECMGRAESGLDPYAIGGEQERGWPQLHPRGKLPRFYADGWLDPEDPLQAAHFFAAQLAAGQGPGAWVRAWRSCA